MKLLSEYKDGEALDLLADLLDPVSEIISDKSIQGALQTKNIKNIDVVKYAIKEHKEAVIHILAILDGVPVEEYHCNVFTLPIKVLQILNDPDLMDFFKLQGLEMKEEGSSISAMENTKAHVK